jgi:hypothetical protein
MPLIIKCHAYDLYQVTGANSDTPITIWRNKRTGRWSHSFCPPRGRKASFHTVQEVREDVVKAIVKNGMLPAEEYITRHNGPIVLTEAVGSLYELFVKMSPKRPLDAEFISGRLRFAESSVTDMINKLNRHYEVKKRADGRIRLQRPPRKSPKAKRLEAAV